MVKTATRPLTWAQERVVDLVQTTKVRKVYTDQDKYHWTAYGDRVHPSTAKVIEELVRRKVLVLRPVNVQLTTMNGPVRYWYLFVAEGRAV